MHFAFLKGVIYKPCGSFFGYFWPPLPPLWIIVDFWLPPLINHVDFFLPTPPLSPLSLKKNFKDILVIHSLYFTTNKKFQNFYLYLQKKRRIHCIFALSWFFSQENNPRGFVTNPPSPYVDLRGYFTNSPSPLVDPHGL